MKKRIMLFFACLFAMASMAMAQSKVSGNVTSSEDGLPIVGASIMVKGTTTGTVTDLDGNFTITGIPSSAKTLVVSYVGMKTKEVAIKANLNIVLDPDQEVLEEVVVTAQGLTRKDKSIGYAAQKVDGEKLQIARQTDLGNALAGKIAGARFVGGSGASFDSGSIVLRGTNGWSSPAGSEPIYVIDGTITNKNALNMDDVASINVLKGSAATALYGSQGGNGAVIITTKAAAMDDGKGHVDFSHTLQWESAYDHFDVQKLYGGGSQGLYGQMYGQMEAYKDVDTMDPAWLLGKRVGKDANGVYYYDMASDESWGPRYNPDVKVADPLYLEGLCEAQGWTHGLDLADLYRTGVTNTTNVAFSKSNKDNNVRISFTNTDRNGIQYNSFAKRRYLTAKTTFKPAKWMNVSLDYKFTWRKTQNGAETGYGALFSEYTQWGQTNVNLKDYKNDYTRADGTFRTWNWTKYNNSRARFHDNPYAIMEQNEYINTYTWNVIAGDVEILLPYNLKAGFRVNGNLRNQQTTDKIPANLINYGTPRYYENQNWVSDMTLQGRLTWGDRFLEDQFTVDAAVFGEERQYHYGTLTAQTAKGLTIPNWFNLANSVDYVSASNSKTEYITRAIFANVTMGYKDTFFLDANIRNDWDSRLAKSDNSFLYGGLSASVMLNNLIAKDSKWLNYWKLRASLAQVGSTLSAYALSDYFSTGKYNSDITLSYRTTQINQNIKPTISTSYEVGTEFRLFDNRFWGDINLYRQDTKNQIMSLSVASQSGFSSRQINAGLIRNQGIEVSLGVTAVKTRDFQWDIDLNVAHNMNKLIELGNEDGYYRLGYNGFGSYSRWFQYAVEGKPVGEIYGGGFLDRDANGNILLYAADDESYWGGKYMPGVHLETAEDQMKEGKSLGNYQPDLTGGFGTTIRYKQFSLGVNFDFMIGGQIASWTNKYSITSGTGAASAKVNDRGVNEREPVAKGGGVHIIGVDAETGQKVDTYINSYAYYHDIYDQNSEACMYDRTYLKLREMSLGYAFTKKQLNKLTKGFLTNASVSFVATNPWLIYSAVPMVDGSEITGSYVEGGSTISTRSFGLTVKLGF
ncbi:MAG: SusC/RagA family TonB-linked outer membrane protein [Bacteroidales bacterium]|nr:SusC/RagA family TonB-linked outer membrane protein [Bacteroidales bacterium]